MADRRNHSYAVVTKQTVAEKTGRRNSDVRTSGSKWPNISAIDLYLHWNNYNNMVGEVVISTQMETEDSALRRSINFPT